MPKITINEKTIEVEEGLTVMQACVQAGVEIPHFCYHKRLKIAGNCRMCLVEMEKAPKPIASCAMPAADGMVIRTDTEKIQQAREGVMEFLLINHPLDCPICDQGGECDLQDQAFKYGRGTNRYHENKRAVADKNLGPLIKTHMTRCIHCTRCIRFASDVAGVPELGAVGRGEHMEITSYLQQNLTSELSGNVIDLCPVGALTSKPYAFTARSWELTKTESIDVMDAMGSNIRVDSKGLEVMRILPRINEDINEEWLSDKARFSYDGLKYQRLDTPYIRVEGKLQPANWQNASTVTASKLSEINPEQIGIIAGNLCNVEALYALKKLAQNLGIEHRTAHQQNYYFDTSSRGNYLFNTTIANVEIADFCLVIGADIRRTAPILNAKLGKRVRNQQLEVAHIGTQKDQTYNILDAGDDLGILTDILAGRHFITDKLRQAHKPMIIIGDTALTSENSMGILSAVGEIIDNYKLNQHDWNCFNILHSNAATVGALDIGFNGRNQHIDQILAATKTGEIKLLYLLAADDFDVSRIAPECKVIYQGHHGEAVASRADIILPEAAYTEQDAIFVNLEGRPQYARAAVSPPGQARPSWQIINELAQLLQQQSIYQNLSQLRQALAEEHEIFKHIGALMPAETKLPTQQVALTEQISATAISNYYMTNIISRASVTMAKCSKAIYHDNEELGK